MLHVEDPEENENEKDAIIDEKPFLATEPYFASRVRFLESDG